MLPCQFLHFLQGGSRPPEQLQGHNPLHQLIKAPVQLRLPVPLLRAGTGCQPAQKVQHDRRHRHGDKSDHAADPIQIKEHCQEQGQADKPRQHQGHHLLEEFIQGIHMLAAVCRQPGKRKPVQPPSVGQPHPLRDAGQQIPAQGAAHRLNSQCRRQHQQMMPASTSHHAPPCHAVPSCHAVNQHGSSVCRQQDAAMLKKGSHQGGRPLPDRYLVIAKPQKLLHQ